MNRSRRARLTWGTLLLLATVAPLAALATVPQRTTGVLIDATGIAAVSSLLAALVLSARLRSLTTTLGLERVSSSHRYLGSLAVAETAVHVALVVMARPDGWALLNPLTATDASLAALVATLALIVLVSTSRLRRRGHELWRRVHLVAALAVMVGVALHVLWLDHLIADEMLGAWFEGAAGVLFVVLLYRWLFRPASASAAYTVRDIRHESESVSTLVLSPRRGRHRSGPRTLEFEPGQFAWLRLSRFGGEEHPYSMSSTAHDAQSLEFTVRHTGDFTDKLADLQRGRTVYLDGPHGTFTPTAEAPGLVMIASGVGMTPILSILRTLADRGDKRPHRLIVAAGTPDQLLFSREIETLRSRLQLEVIATVRAGAPGWRGRIGPVDGPLLATVLPGRPVRDRFVYFVCGPRMLIADALSALHILKVPTTQIRTERFDSSGDKRRERHSLGGQNDRTARTGNGPTGRHSGSAIGSGRPDADSGSDGGSDRIRGGIHGTRVDLDAIDGGPDSGSIRVGGRSAGGGDDDGEAEG